MNKILMMATAGMFSFAMGATAAFADPVQSFEFEEAGDGSLNFDFGFTATEETTVSNGAEFAFNGGAGTNGDATAEGEYALVGGIFGEVAIGAGNAYSNTDGESYAEASFASGAFAANGGVAYDETFGNNPAEMSFSGIVTAGGAGSVDTGSTTGSTYTYDVAGGGSYDYTQNSSSSEPMVP